MAEKRKTSVVVVGAGVFGGWAALYLLRLGAKVTLIDAWGPGNSRASSGGETRIIRATYGPLHLYSQMAVDALRLWKENQRRWQQKLFFHTGVLWMVGENDAYEQEAMKTLKQVGQPFEKLSTGEAAKRWPQVSFENVSWAIFEPEAGYLLARRSCELVLEAFHAEGGQYRVAQATPGKISGNEMQAIQINGSEELQADRLVFACGPWLPQVFPFLAGKIRPSKQEVFFFGTAAGGKQFTDETLPTWMITGHKCSMESRGTNGGDSSWPAMSGGLISIRHLVSAAPVMQCFRRSALIWLDVSPNARRSSAGDSRLPVRKQP